MKREDLERFKNLSFDDFRRLARDETLSRYEKIGFPNTYREGKEELIFQDILRKLPNLQIPGQTVMDVGPGCSDLALMEIAWAREKGHRLIFVDSQEMLDLLPDVPFLRKVSCYYPTGCPELLYEMKGQVDVMIVYSVFHYIFADGKMFEFLDKSLALLAAGGEMLIGDIPNISKRKRFFSSEAGIQFHKAFMQTDEPPVVAFSVLEDGKIDDSVIMALIMRARSFGFEGYWLPQPEHLPMANRREDVVIKRF